MWHVLSTVHRQSVGGIAGMLIAASLLSCSDAIVYDTSAPSPPPESTSGWFKEWLGDHVLPLFNESDTEYATGFTEEKFRSIPVGASEVEVTRLIGEPLATNAFPDGHKCWYYSQHGKKSDNYYIRAVRFGPDGRVAELLAGFELD